MNTGVCPKEATYGLASTTWTGSSLRLVKRATFGEPGSRGCEAWDPEQYVMRRALLGETVPLLRHLGPTRVRAPNDTLIGSSAFAGFTLVTNEHKTDRPRYMRNNKPHLMPCISTRPKLTVSCRQSPVNKYQLSTVTNRPERRDAVNRAWWLLW